MASTELRAAAQQALEALTPFVRGSWTPGLAVQAAAAMDRLKAALAEPVEPVKQCMAHGECFGGECIYQRPAEPVQEPEPVATMTVREDIIRMAREAGLKVATNISGVTLVGAPLGDTPSIGHITIDEMARFTALVVAAERERNAKIADAHASCKGIGQVIAAEIRGQA